MTGTGGCGAGLPEVNSVITHLSLGMDQVFYGWLALGMY